LEITGKQKRIETATEAADAVRESEMKLLRDRAAIAQKVREITSVPVGITGMQEAHRKQVQDVETTYNAIIEIARQAGISTVGLEKQKQQEISQLEFEYQNSLYQIQSQIGVSWAQEYQNELALLKNLHDQELIDEKTYQRKKLQMQMNNAKKYFDYYSGLSSSMVEAIQQAEIDQVEAKYDVLIQLVAVKLFAFLDNIPQAKIDCIVLFCAGQERFSFDIIAACIQKDKGFLEIINVVQYGSSGCLDSFRNHASTDITGRKRIADIVQQECKDIT